MMAKLRISERNTKEKLVFLFIPEREELRQAQSYEKSRAKQKNLCETGTSPMVHLSAIISTIDCPTLLPLYSSLTAK